MKLSKRNAARQSVIHRAIASGKALGGLLVGFAATVAGCGERHSSAHTMGRFPDPRYRENATNENAALVVTEGEVAAPAPESSQTKTNAVREKQGKSRALQGEPVSPARRKAPQK